jgi:hypothetical protein
MLVHRTISRICHSSKMKCPFRVCAVQRRRFPVGENPTRQSLQPEAIGAVMEVTKWLKPSISVFFEKGLNVPEGAHHPSS